MFDQQTINLLQNVIKREGKITLPATGNSMFPYIRRGDSCTFIPFEPDELKRGDIALFHQIDGRLVAHRFFYVHHDQYLFKGDSNQGFDHVVAKEQLIGKLVSIKRNNRLYAPSAIWKMMILNVPMLSGMIRLYINKRKC
ncbi:S24 family peptidase [Falsibacillus pallidus]|uniref:S24 family peptidase n=1 Tax=Falsibacillus pallidus TaxID=493781 RepID=UPI000E0BC9A2|nr:S24 family peptidase [Falsibacillus pallidus]